jgi:4'-phosphopantetheinyl transferase
MEKITPPTEEEVHIWQVDVARLAPQQVEFSALLPPGERARAQTFHTERQRSRYICRRGLLRRIVGVYTGRDPQTLVFGYGPYGKPALAEAPSLSFSVSHSADLLLIAFALRRALGVDVERIRPVEDIDTLARRILTAAEQQHFFSLPSDLRLSAFFACWTLKEAIMKASGRGIALPAAQIGIGWAADGSPQLAHIAGDPVAALRWHLHQPDLGPDYVAALAVDGEVSRVRSCQWPMRIA